MFLHIGQAFMVSTPSILGIFDLDTATHGRVTRDFLRRAEEEGRVIPISEEELPKSFLLCEDLTGTHWVYLSPLHAATLARRAGLGFGAMNSQWEGYYG